jgi:hypothetical protein
LRQRYAYMSLLYSVNKETELLWYDSENECDWLGVSCTNGTVTSVRLGGKGLTGTIPADVGLWTRLKVFDVIGNYIKSTLPTTIGNWIYLETLNVNYNKFTGNVPSEVSAWTSLRNAYFNGNGFSGTMPRFGTVASDFCPRYQDGKDLYADCNGNVDIVCECCDLCCATAGSPCYSQ